MEVQERELASQFNCEAKVMKNIFFAILREHGDALKEANSKCEEDCECHRHMFVRTDNNTKQGKEETLKEEKIEEVFYTVPGSGDHGLYSFKDTVRIYYPTAEYKYRFMQCLGCKKMFISIKIGEDSPEVILDCHLKPLTRTEILDLQLFGNVSPRTLVYDVVDDYEIVDFTKVLSKMRMLYEGNDYYKLSERDVLQLYEEIQKKMEEYSTPEERIAAIRELKADYDTRIEQNEEYKKILKSNQEFLKWIS